MMDEYFHGERRDLKSLKQKLRQQKTEAETAEDIGHFKVHVC